MVKKKQRFEDARGQEVEPWGRLWAFTYPMKKPPYFDIDEPTCMAICRGDCLELAFEIDESQTTPARSDRGME